MQGYYSHINLASAWRATRGCWHEGRRLGGWNAPSPPARNVISSTLSVPGVRENMLMKTSLRRWFAAGLAGCLLLAGAAQAQSGRKKSGASSTDFSYYLLVLSYAPDFCAEPGGNKDPRECGAGLHIGFIVHGLWPQGENSQGPENCGGASALSQAIIQATLAYIPIPSLIQHEWTAHGTCSGLSAADFFAALRRARDSVTLPAALNQPPQQLQLSPAQVESQVAAANPSFPAAAFRTSCYKDAELEEVRVCLNKDLSPRACGSSAGECTAPSVTILPVR
jgi:ribonuclease T2